MSLFLINKFKEELERIIQFGGSRNEGAISFAFQKLLNEYCNTKNLLLVQQLEIKTKDGKTVRPDGTIKDSLRLDWGYWESKDSKDDIDTEIKKKIDKGYPLTNILFEDSHNFVLFQDGAEVERTTIDDPFKLDELLTRFVGYERPEIHDFRAAIEQFKEDIPSIIEALREIIEKESAGNKNFRKARDEFYELCQKSINPNLTLADIREMIIQHILTEEIFLEVFSETSFHRENNIARELQNVVNTFFTGKTKKETLIKIENYYKVIRRTATDIADHHEKQKFLKVLYENFYKVYNPKAADKLGVVYTPNEIVRFMIESTDYLLHKTFGRFIGDKNVEILDPFTGTGTFITELIDYLPHDELKHKYNEEIHCNEVAILPYYVANLNIEYTYYQKMQQYEEFKNICFVDTLDNLAFGFKDQQTEMFGFAAENTDRIKKQNERKISVIISNPPYNANQLNENENNKNREYEHIDALIKKTWIKASTAQKTKMYDMYARALKWAETRLNKNGIVAFISNNSFIDSKTYDGFRKEIVNSFNEIYIIDLKGNARTSGERRRREAGNVFDDQIRVGVAVYFLVRKEGKTGCDIYYNAIGDYARSEEKRNYLSENRFEDLKFTHIIPDKDGNWINLVENDFESFIPIANKQTKFAKSRKEENAIFKLFSLGVATNRDEWVYDYDVENLKNKVNFFCDFYEKEKERWIKSKRPDAINDFVNRKIKWTSELESHLKKETVITYQNKYITTSYYRPFFKQFLYYDKIVIHRVYLQDIFFPFGENVNNKQICFSGVASNKPFYTLITGNVSGLDFLEKTQCLPFYYFNKDGNKLENITDWGLRQFQEHYNNKKITKEDIFSYVYGVLHNPAYRKNYEQNLKREFPRIPFYEDFYWWVKKGEALMELYLNYETITPYRLKCLEEKEKKPSPKCILKADKDNGIIYLDENTQLSGIPKEAWEYKLGNRSAIEWILEQYKEKKIKDPTVRAKFNTYKFADYKEEVIDLIKKVCKVSVETVKIIDEMKDKNN